MQLDAIMRKLLLALILLILIVAVSYIQAVMQQKKADNSFWLGRKSNQQEMLALQNEAESLKTRMGEQEILHAETLLQRDKMIHSNVDSLSKIIESQKNSITELKKKTEAAESDQRHRELLTYYKKRFESLPTDLTEYERKIAISELRQETADKYAISLVEFNRLREKFKLNF